MSSRNGGATGPTPNRPDSVEDRDESPPKHVPITIATYNICSGRKGRLELALRAAAQMNLDLGILTETKLTDGIYTRNSSGYQVVATDAPSKHQGGIALFYRESEYWQVESLVKHGPNVISFELVSGRRRTPMIGGYIPPDDLTTLPHISAALTRFSGHRDAKRLVFLGDLNVDLSSPSRDARSTSIVDCMSAQGFEDLLLHFKSNRRYAHGKTWWQERQGAIIRSRCDYILGLDRRIFSKVCLKDPRCFTSDHYMVVGKLLSAPLSSNLSYLRGRTRFPVRAPKWGPHTKVDSIFQDLTAAIDPPTRANRVRSSWISDETWALVDARASLRRAPNRDRTAFRRLDRKVKSALKQDRLRRMEETAEAIDRLLEEKNVEGAWGRLKAWYKHAGDRPCAPSRADLQRTSDEYQDLYSRADPPGEPIPVLVAPFDICDEIPSEEEIERHVKRLKNGKSPGPTGMRAEHLKGWLEAARRKEMPDGTHWCLLVSLVQECFATGVLPAQLPWSTMVLLPKGGGDFRGIGLLEICWKLITSILDARIKDSVEFHDALHGFRAGRGTGTAIIEAKLLQQLAAIRQVPLYEIFLDLRKAYDTLDRDRTLQILEGYGVGPRALGLLRSSWQRQTVVARQGRYYGEPFPATRGVTQGDIISPTIFNIVCDAIIRQWINTVSDDGRDPVEGFGLRVEHRAAMFYADDGLLASRSASWLQQALEVLAELFERVGLRTNTTKTVAMTCVPGFIRSHMSDASYRRRTSGEGETLRERQRRRVVCPECSKSLAASSLSTHLLSQHGIASRSQQAPADRRSAEYRVSFPKTLRRLACPVEGCGGSAVTHEGLRRHFMHRHVTDTIVILQEGTTPLPRCELCDMFVGPYAIGRSHQNTAHCRRGAAAKRRRHALEDVRASDEVIFSVSGSPLDRVGVFKYLGRMLSDTDNDWPAVYKNLSKARKRWGMVSRILRRDGLRPKAAGMFYKAVVQAVLLYGAETWAVSPAMLKALEGFHHRVARQLTGKVGRYLPREDRWYYPPIEEALEEAGLFPIKVYIDRRQNTLVDHVATRPLLGLCLDCDKLDGSSRAQLWWEQSNVAALVTKD